MRSPQKFTLVDPRSFEGDPFEVAGRGVGQMRGVIDLLHENLEDAETMGRNAFMERQARLGEEIDVEKWNGSAEFRAWQRVKQQIASARGALKALQETSSFDPKRPPQKRL